MESSKGRSPVVDTLRITDQERRQILSELDGRQISDAASDRREHERVPYQEAHGLLVVMSHPGGNVVKYLVKPRNLSETGVGFLHGNFVHIGTACIMAIKTRSGKPILVNGHVARCIHVRSNVHEVGVHFEEPIDLDEIDLDGPAETTPEDPADS